MSITSSGAWVLALASITLSALGQTFMKIGMSKPAVQAALGEGVASAVVAILLSPAVLGGLAVYGCGAAMWLLVLSKLPVSAVYPLVSLAIVFVVLIGTLFLKETASWGRIGGVAIVVTGLILVSRG